MTLTSRLCGRMAGSGQEKERRQAIATALLEAFERGGEEAVSQLLKEKMKELEGRFQGRLAALEANL